MQIYLGNTLCEVAIAAPHFSPTGTGRGEESGAVCVCANELLGYNRGKSLMRGNRTRRYLDNPSAGPWSSGPRTEGSGREGAPRSVQA